ncbi:MAG: amino acid adenylation domain-containing protein [Caulobacterales bacterium]|nr:amino acid adenylation domain-containing protein [Caulobacterales bacterium]
MLIPDALEQAADRAPHAVAFRYGEDALTYAALAQSARRLAAALVQHGLAPGDRVAVCAPKGLHLPVSVYGAMRGGGAYVPVDPRAPDARVDAILRDCDVRFLLTGPEMDAKAERIAAAHPDIRLIVGAGEDRREPLFLSWADIDHIAPLASPHAADADDLAYVMYTSGSTGAPKGLAHTHASGLAYARMAAKLYGLGPEDRLGNHAALHFDQSTFEYFAGPSCGATTVLIPEETIMFPAALAALIEAERLTHWHSIPSTLVRLVTSGALEGRDLSALRWVIFGGEPFAPRRLRAVMDAAPGAQFSNSYGPAEVNQCTYHHVARAASRSEAPAPLGRMCEGAHGLVVDDDGALCAIDEPGELLVAAPTMMRGYWNRPDLDARAFVTREAATGEEARFYRTGDMVRRDDDGLLHFIGRRDRQVKVRGHRVELDEVEAALSALSEVAEAAAVTAAAPDGERMVVAAVTLRPGAEATPAALRKGAGRTLPVYATPARLEIREALPRTPTGKIDRPRLAAELAAAD